MKFRRTPQFKEDYDGLEETDQSDVDNAFRSVAMELQGDVELFMRHRIRRMEGWVGIWEGHVKQNLCFTFHYEYLEDGEKICFFRRIGTHQIYDKP